MSERHCCAFLDGSGRRQLRQFNYPVIRVLKEFVIIHSEVADFSVFHAFDSDFPRDAKRREFTDAFSAHDSATSRRRRAIRLFLIAPVSADNEIFVPHIFIRHTDAIIAKNNLRRGANCLIGNRNLDFGGVGIPTVGHQFPDDRWQS